MYRISLVDFLVARKPWILTLILLGLVAASWLLGLSRPTASTASSIEGYFANTLNRTGANTERLIAKLQERLRRNPDDWQSYSQLGLAYLQRVRETGDPGYYQKAEGVLDEALRLEPNDYVATSAMGTLALARHQFSQALKWGEQALAVNPDRPYAYGVMVDALVELGRYAEAVETLQKMIDLRPDMSSYARASYLRELHGDQPGALEMMQSAVDSGGAVSENTAWARTQLANLYFNMGDLQNAELEYRRTLQGSPNYAYALAGLGRVRAAQGRSDDAIALLKQAGQIVPLPEFVITLGELYESLDRRGEAHEQYKLLQFIQELYQANGVDIDLEMALFNADHSSDPGQVVEQARQGYSRRPSVYAADVLAWALFKAGKVEEAQAYSRQALHLGSKDALKLFHAGMIAFKLGQTAEARRFIQEALEITPNFSVLYAQEARQMLEDLNSQ